jgi:hypothetical protein
VFCACAVAEALGKQPIVGFISWGHRAKALEDTCSGAGRAVLGVGTWSIAWAVPSNITLSQDVT